jgi:hypothetical protein
MQLELSCLRPSPSAIQIRSGLAGSAHFSRAHFSMGFRCLVFEDLQNGRESTANKKQWASKDGGQRLPPQKAGKYPANASFGTRGSQVQILPLRLTFSHTLSLTGNDSTKPSALYRQDSTSWLSAGVALVATTIGTMR